MKKRRLFKICTGCKAKVDVWTMKCELGHKVMYDPSRRHTSKFRFKSCERCEKPDTYKKLDALKREAA